MNFDELIGRKLADRYAIEELLGKGAYGAVFRALHLSLDGPVAIKVLHAMPSEHDDPSARFQREARTLSRLRHPHIVEVIDFGADGEIEYLVLEYITGRDLSDLLAEAGPLAWPEVARVARQICLALASAHSSGVVHRDLKPANVMLVDLPGAPNHVKVLDFGIAKIVDPEAGAIEPGTFKTKTGIAMGTPAYMAPEQWQGKPIDGRTDLYALGVLMWVMLSGKPPFSGDNMFEVLRKAVTEPLPALGVPSGRPAIPAKLERLIRKLLAKHMDRRPADATEVATELELLAAEGLAGAPVAEPVPRRAPQERTAVVLTSSPELQLSEPAGAPTAPPARAATPAPAAPTPTPPSPRPEASVPTQVSAAVPPADITTASSAIPTGAAGPPKRLVLAAAVVAAAALAFALLRDSGPVARESATAQPAPAPAAASAAPAPSPPPAPRAASVQVVVTSDPSGAMAQFQGSALGPTPVTSSIDASPAVVGDRSQWTFTLTGHEPGELTVDRAAGGALKLHGRLVPSVAATPRARAASPPKARPKPTPRPRAKKSPPPADLKTSRPKTAVEVDLDL